MIFPFTIKYQKHIDIQTSDDNAEQVMKSIKDFIKEKNVDIVTSNKTKLIFKPAFFSRNLWSIYASIERGEFNIIPEKDKYKLSYEFFMFKFFIIISIISALMWFVFKEIEMVFMGFAWLGGMSWFVAIIGQRLMFLGIIKRIRNLK